MTSIFCLILSGRLNQGGLDAKNCSEHEEYVQQFRRETSREDITWETQT